MKSLLPRTLVQTLFAICLLSTSLKLAALHSQSAAAGMQPAQTVLNYATRTAAGRGIAVDSQGNAYVAAGNDEIRISKINSAGTQILYSANIGGTNDDLPTSIAIDAAGAVYATGRTFSGDFAAAFPGVNPGFGAGVFFKSLDGAQNWNSSSRGLNSASTKLIVDPANSNVIYAGYDNLPTISKSTDAGVSWSVITPFSGSASPATLLALVPGGLGTLFATADGSLRKSIDGGASWTAAGLNQPVSSLIFDPRNTRTLYASVKASPVAIYRSMDGGDTWNVVNTGLNNLTPTDVRLIIDPTTSTTIYAVAYTPAGGSAPFNVLVKSVDGGVNWTPISMSEFGSVYSVTIDPVNSLIVYAGTLRGVFKSTDGAKNWKLLGLENAAIHALAIDPANLSTLYALANTSANKTVAVGQIYKSTNGGVDWALAENRLKVAAVRSFALDPQNSARLYAGAEPQAESIAFKLNPSGTGLEYAVYLGGLSGNGIALDAAGNAYIAGEGTPRELPNGLPTPVSRGFLLKLNTRGEVVYGTGLPGPANGVAVDNTGKAYVVGRINDADSLPVKNGFQTASGGGGSDGYVIKLDTQKAGIDSLLFATYLGGGGSDGATRITLNAEGQIYVAGMTDSRNFPLTREALSSIGGIFCTKIDPAKTGPNSLIWSTLMNGVSVNGIGVGQNGNIVLAGAAGDGLPITPGAMQAFFTGGACATSTCNCPLVLGSCPLACTRFKPPCTDAFFTMINATGSAILYSSYFGSEGISLNESVNGLALDAAGNAYLTGIAGLPASAGALQSSTDSGFTAKLTLNARNTTVATVSAASYAGSQLAPESLAVGFLDAFGAGADRLKVVVRDNAGTEREAPVLFAGSGQVNFQAPPSTGLGEATVKVTTGSAAIALGTVQIVSVAPGLFAANANGRGVAAAVVQRVRADNSQAYESLARYDESLKQFIATPIDLGPESDQVYLALFGTGLRFRTAQSAVKVTVGGIEVPVLYADKQPTLTGVDQINVRLPRTLLGKGELDLIVTVDGKTANTVKVNIK